MAIKRFALALLVAFGLAFGGLHASAGDVAADPPIKPRPCGQHAC